MPTTFARSQLHLECAMRITKVVGVFHNGRIKNEQGSACDIVEFSEATVKYIWLLSNVLLLRFKITFFDFRSKIARHVSHRYHLRAFYLLTQAYIVEA